jgi:hypothetical protein
MKSLFVLALALLACVPARAGDHDAERKRIADERGALEARFLQQQKACRATFAVTDCIHKAQRERNTALTELRRQEQAINDVERRHRSAEHQKEVEERSSPEARAKAEERRRLAVEEQKEREARAAEKAARRADDEAKKAARGPREPKAPTGPHGAQGAPRAPQAPKAHGPTPEEAAKSRAAHEAHIKEAEQHNAHLQERIAKRKKPAASDLPMPQ